MELLSQLSENTPLQYALISWIVSSALKIPSHYIVSKQWDWRVVFSTGGMPSTHSALVYSFAVAAGLTEGFDSTLFALSLLFSLVVSYDAAGVRKQSGIQAQKINELMCLFKDVFSKDIRLKESIGHTFLQVFAGGLLGVLLSTALYFFRVLV